MVAGGCPLSRKKTPVELDDARCTATSKASGQRCRRWAVSGYAVCPMHGAGAPARRRFPGPDGRPRRDPRISRLRHGLYSSRLPAELGRVVAEFYEDKAALFSLETVAARLWALLLHCDAVELAVDDDDLRDPDRAGAALQAVDAVRRVLHELINVAKAHARITQRSAGVSIDDVVGIVASILMWTHEIAADERVPRGEIARRLADRVERAGGAKVPVLGEPVR